MADAPKTEFRALDAFTLADTEAMWNVLQGVSVVDWQRLYFETDAAVEEFLRVQGFDPHHPDDRERMDAIRDDAVDYLRRTFAYPIPRPVAAMSVEELLRLASSKGHRQLCACVILKVMHIIQHLHGRELLFVLPLSDAQLFGLVEAKIYEVIGEMMADRLPVAEFLGGRKSRDSLYTKLLSKRENIATQVYDKLRFRVVTRTRDDVLPVLNYLSRRLFPFSFVIPGESKNTLLDPADLRARHPHLRALMEDPLAHPRPWGMAEVVDNKFSARSYRVVHFVVDVPVRVPAEVLAAAPPSARRLGNVVFVLVEFQVVDMEAANANEQGDASHDSYKERQRQAVRQRLSLGAVRPARRREK